MGISTHDARHAAGADVGSEEARVRAAAGGDRAALEQLLRDNFSRIHAVCRRVTANAQDAQDATQEALLLVARRIGTFDGRSAFSTWVYRIAMNAAIDEVRRRKRRPVPFDEIPAGVASQGPFEVAAVARLDVDTAMSHLHPDYRAAVVCRDLCGMDYAEIAETLGVPIGTVRSRIARGRAALSRMLAA